MIEVINLTKMFGRMRAVDNISFNVEKGEILGFLGPNGAGKSTSMRMITGFIPPTSGTAVVGGYDITNASISAREKNRLFTGKRACIPGYDRFFLFKFLR